MADTEPMRKDTAAQWVGRQIGRTLTDGEARCVDTISAIATGPHNVLMSGRDRDDRGWRFNGHGSLEVRLKSPLSTFDDSTLTALVVAAHRNHVRVGISGMSRQSIRVWLHPRSRDGDLTKRHPGVDALAQAWRAER